MKAVRYHDYGGPEVLCYEGAPIPEPGPREVLVRVHAAGVNPADRQIRAGLRFGLEKPFAFIPGCELSGVVDRTGAEVTELRVGDEVYGMPGFEGGYAEYVVVAAYKLGRKPASLDHVHAAALPVAALTAWDALFEVGGLIAGQRVLVHAAAGGVGHIAVQLAKWRGAEVIGTASARNEAFLNELGVDMFIDYRATAFESVVHDVDVVLDLIPREADEATDALARETMARSWGVLKNGGIQVSICANPTPPPGWCRAGSAWRIRPCQAQYGPPEPGCGTRRRRKAHARCRHGPFPAPGQACPRADPVWPHPRQDRVAGRGPMMSRAQPASVTVG